MGRRILAGRAEHSFADSLLFAILSSPHHAGRLKDLITLKSLQNSPNMSSIYVLASKKVDTTQPCYHEFLEAVHPGPGLPSQVGDNTGLGV